MSDAPERIWLQDDGDYSKARLALSDLTWCEDQINDADTEYRRADLPPTDAARVDSLVEENTRLRGLLRAALTGRVENDLEWQIDARAAVDEGK